MTDAGVQASHALTITDINTAHGEEPRIRDTRIGERLGMAQPLDIRRTIEANREELERYGTVFAHRAKTSVKGGRPSIAYYLNEPQALLLCMFSRTSCGLTATNCCVTVPLSKRVRSRDGGEKRVRRARGRPAGAFFISPMVEHDGGLRAAVTAVGFSQPDRSSNPSSLGRQGRSCWSGACRKAAP